MPAAGANPASMLSALMMLRRVLPAFRYAIREEEFLQIFSAAVLLVVVGTLTYAFGNDWHVVDALYFSVSTLTTTSVSNPELVITDRWLEIFTVLYQLFGIGILVETLRRLGIAFITVRKQEKELPQG
jgi:Ion channel